jgi:hypothetical protein
LRLMQRVVIPTSKLPTILVCILRQLEKLSGMAGGEGGYDCRPDPVCFLLRLLPMLISRS